MYQKTVLKKPKTLVSVRISTRDNTLLKKLSRELQLSQAEVVSRALELCRRHYEKTE